MRRIIACTITTALALCETACPGAKQPCFNQSSLVTDPRILAVRTDPPASIIDPTGQMQPDPVDVSALVVTSVVDVLGEYGRAIQVTGFETIISVCLPPTLTVYNPQPGCPPGSTVVADLPAVPDINTPFSYSPSIDLLQQAIAQDPLHGLSGVQLRLQIEVQTTPTITATKALTFQLRDSPATVNHSLEITGIETSNAGVHQTVMSPATVNMIVAQTIGLRPLIGPGPGGTDAVETYLGYDNSGNLVALQEHVTYAFYAGNALFFGTPHNGQAAIYTGAAGDVADEPAPGSPDPPDGLVTTEALFVGNQAGAFWVVASDGRGAVVWKAIPYAATDPRTCAISNGPQAPAHCPTLFYGCN